MIILGTNSIKDTGFNVDNSVRMSGSTVNLQRDFSGDGNRRTWTYSTWFKLSNIKQSGFFNWGKGNPEFSLRFESTTSDASLNQFRVSQYDNSQIFDLVTTQYFRDPSAWGHMVVAFDTTQGTASNRIKVYFNGTQITSFSTESYPDQNFETFVNQASKKHYIGYADYQPINGYLCETVFIDGQQLAPDQFGEFDDSGIWKPKDVSGLTFGTNGYYLQYKEAGTSQNASGIGADTSGGTNHFACDDVVAIDQSTDTCTNNFATMNPLDLGATTDGEFLQGNLDVHMGGTAQGVYYSTIGVSTGKWYVEVNPDSASGGNSYIGISGNANSSRGANDLLGDLAYDYGFYQDDGKVRNNDSDASYGSSYSNGNIIGVYLDLDNNKLYFSINGTVQNSGTGVSISAVTNTPTGNYFFCVGDDNAYAERRFNLNFGSPIESISSSNTDDNGYGNFEYSPNITGDSVAKKFYSLNTKKFSGVWIMAYTTIDKPSDYFNTVLYTGDASSPRTISGVGFQPDWNWSKSRNSADYDHNVADSVRGGSAYYLKTNTDVAETGNPAAGYVSSFNSDGYVLTAGGSNNTNYNNNSTTYVSWNWKAGTSFTNDASSTSIGSIDSAGSVSTDAGFSIVSFTGTGSNGTIKHGLSTAPSMVIIKRRDSSNDWRVGSDGLTNWTKHVNLNTEAAQSDLASAFNSTAPTSSVFSVGTSASTNASGGTYIAYCFSSIKGYSKVGSYTGNGSTDGTFIYTGFKPAWIMIKRTDNSSGSRWLMLDNKRNTFNVLNKNILGDASDAEVDVDRGDFLSNGFKTRSTGTTVNGSGASYIYMAFAESPFVTSTGVPATAR